MPSFLPRPGLWSPLVRRALASDFLTQGPVRLKLSEMRGVLPRMTSPTAVFKIGRRLRHPWVGTEAEVLSLVRGDTPRNPWIAIATPGVLLARCPDENVARRYFHLWNEKLQARTDSTGDVAWFAFEDTPLRLCLAFYLFPRSLDLSLAFEEALGVYFATQPYSLSPTP